MKVYDQHLGFQSNLDVSIVIRTILAAFILILGSSFSASAQQAPKVWKIGVLVSASRALNAARDDALWEGLRQLGYIEGKNAVMEYRYADGELSRLPELAAELVALKVDVIVVSGTRAAMAAKQATSSIPIVLAGVGDPVQAGLINSLTHPGTNVTGISRLSPDFIGKRVELIKEVVPSATRMAVLSNPDNPAEKANLREINIGARASGMTLQILAAQKAADFQPAFSMAAKERSDALLVMPDALFHSHPSEIAGLAAKSQLPAVYDRSDFVDAGGLMSLAVNVADLSRRAAAYVDRILAGARPAETAVEQPTRYDLVVNLKAA
ncbi:MAG TPA: ABC transporter substrate-binding protein, partial [Candidatus Binatia bacterium]